MNFQKFVLMAAMAATFASAPLPRAVAQEGAATQATAFADYPPIRQRDGILVDLKGRGLYTYDGDTDPKKSLCDAQCRLLWPPVFADAGAKPRGQFTIVARNDGRQQWAYKGKPLYRWASDRKRGDAGGDNISGVWHLVRVPKPVPTYVPEPQKPATTPAKP
jgi:predicted lipoprotein with Yx(FWY)xxD motif